MQASVFANITSLLVWLPYPGSSATAGMAPLHSLFTRPLCEWSSLCRAQRNEIRKNMYLQNFTAKLKYPLRAAEHTQSISPFSPFQCFTICIVPFCVDRGPRCRKKDYFNRFLKPIFRNSKNPEILRREGVCRPKRAGHSTLPHP